MPNYCPITLPKWHPKQLAVFNSPASEILFAGDTRAGKSFFVRKAMIVWCSQIPGLQCDIFRLHYDDVVAENMQGETGFPVLLAEWVQGGLAKITESSVVFWNQSRIDLEHCGDDIVMKKHQGIAKHVRAFGESCQILEHRIRALTGWVTMSEDMKARVPDKWKGQFPKVLHVTNTIGPSNVFYRRGFVEAREPYKIEKVGQFNRQYIPAFLEDNPSEDQDATKARISEAFTDPAIQRALINEDKSGVTNWRQGGGEFFPEWNIDRHVIPDCIPPAYWTHYRGLDLGYAEPFCCLWAAVSDGEPFKDQNNKERWFPRGCLVVYREWYGCDPKDPSRGIRMRNEDIASGILQRSEHSHRNVPTLTDSLAFQDRGGEGPSQAFARCGVQLTLGDTSRVTGWAQVRGRLIGKTIFNNEDKKYPLIQFCESCHYTIDYMPSLPRHPSDKKREDAAEHGEQTHAPDTVRLICAAHEVIKDTQRPTELLVQRELRQKRPTIKNILTQMGGPRLG